MKERNSVPLARGGNQNPSHAHRPGDLQRPVAVSLLKHPPSPPAAYRPQGIPRAVQTKTLAPHQAAIQSGRGGGTPVAPPAYRPQPLPRVLQTKIAGEQNPGQSQPARQAAVRSG